MEFPKDIKFKYNWRKYQQRVLDELQDHLADGHLHVIAPPGSGKTILGLEVAIRLNKPTLILAPTLAIRNQWIQRFCTLFLQIDATPDWISRDIKHPKFITVVTYQGLHAACNNFAADEKEMTEEEEHEEERTHSTYTNLDHIVGLLQSQNIKTIVVDEAHHLKNEWWQTLTKIKEKIDPIIVGLTATPPYDVTPAEWRRYQELNGPVDTEIYVPELVIEGDLCPHQDYVYFTLPTEKEAESIVFFRQNIETLFNDIKNDETLINAIKNHPIWINPLEKLDWIYNNVPYYSACLIFLNHNEYEIPATHLEVIGSTKTEIPIFDYYWAETLLDFYLFKEKEYFKPFEEHQKRLEKRLQQYGAVEKRQINFFQNNHIKSALASSISKLNGIKAIVDFEHMQLGAHLRMVILSDYIRKDFLINSPENNMELNKIGVIPIFEKLRRESSANKKIGVLSGSIIIIPQSAYATFETQATQLGITQINVSVVPFDHSYVVIHQTEPIKNDIIHIVTQIFQRGEIEVLIGTKSLLGEGWDAPAINSLILASVVGSFVSSNQMRGRAIRVQRGNTDKTGNIWHLATIDPTSPSGGYDFEILKRRFRSFVGISFEEVPCIENGIRRLNLPENIQQQEEIDQKNSETLAYAGDRNSLKTRWETALKTGVTLVEEIKIPFQEQKEYKAVLSMYYKKTIANLVATLVSGLFWFIWDVVSTLIRSAKDMHSLNDLYHAIAFFSIIGIIIFGRLTLKTLRLYLKYRDITKDVHQIGAALLNALIQSGSINGNNIKLKINTSTDQYGAVFCHLEGASTFERSIFIKALDEIMMPVQNPRYIIIRKHTFMGFIQQRDYHSVPEILGKNKALAEFFRDQWERIVGSCDMVFTSSIEGRKTLLKSRIKSLAAQFNKPIEYQSKWK
jgi:superfamily II DNA or RNA helicase